MLPLLPAIIGGGALLASTYFTNEANKEQADTNRKFQADMSGSAHQREVADLRAAGLNPILSAGGQGASTPQGNVAEIQDPLKAGLESAIAIRQQNKDLEAKQAGIDNAKADTKNKDISSALIANQTAATAKDIEAKTLQNKMLTKTMDAAIKKAKAEGDFAQINQIMGVINSGASSAGQLIPAGRLFKQLQPPVKVNKK